MRNETELVHCWGEIRSRGAAALRPNLARRVIMRVAAAREDFNARHALVVGLGTALACVALTLAVNLWTISSASDRAIDQWNALTSEDYAFDTGI